MTFTYYYKTGDGIRHEAEISAPSLDEAFQALRQQGIRPIKVLSKDGGRVAPAKLRGRTLGLLATAIALLAGSAFWTLGRWSVGRSAYLLSGGKVSRGVHSASNLVRPTTRHQIAGDQAMAVRVLQEGAKFLFRYPSERFLAVYAIPGRAVAADAKMTVPDTDFAAALKSPIYTFPGEMQECVELKRIVAGMKEELKMFLASGGTVREYVSRVQGRQEMECAYLEKARSDLAAALSAKPAAEAYATWTGLNAWLNAMGIQRLPLPPQLAELDERNHPENEPGVIESTPVLLP